MKKRSGFSYIEMMIVGVAVCGISLTAYNSLLKNVDKVSTQYITYYDNFYSEVNGEEYTLEEINLRKLLKEYIELDNCIEVEGEIYCKIKKEE